MEKRARGSFTVEAALIYPMIFLILIAFLELGSFLSLEVKARAILTQTAELYSYCRSQGTAKEDAERKARNYMENAFGEMPVRASESLLSVDEGWLEDSIRLEATLSFASVLTSEIHVVKNAACVNPRYVRDIFSVLSEDVHKIPGSEAIWNRYEEYIEQWADAMK